METVTKVRISNITETGCGHSFTRRFDIAITLADGVEATLYKKADPRLAMARLRKLGLTNAEMDALFGTREVTGSWQV